MDEQKPMRELTRIREERGLSQQGLADISGVNKATINQIERGRRSPNARTLEKLAAALSVEVADLFPKVQAPLPLDESQRRASNDPPKVYTAYEALGHVLAAYWREDLAEWDEKMPPGGKELENSEHVWGLLAWVGDMSQTTSAFAAVAREGGFQDRPEFREALAEMDAAKAAGMEKLGRILKRMKTDVEFHRILAENDLLKELEVNG